MVKNKTALFCYGSIDPDPNGAGAARRFWVDLRALELAGFNVVEVQFTNTAKSDGKNIISLPEWKRPNGGNRFVYQYFKWIYPWVQPQAAFYPQFDRNAANQLLQFVHKHKPDIMFYEHSAPWVTGSQLKLAIPSFLCIHDFDHVLNGTKSINYLKKVRPKGIRRYTAILREKWIAFCLRKYSFELFRKSDRVLTCGRSDFDALHKKGINSTYIPIPVFQIPGENNLQLIKQKLEKHKSFNDFVKVVHIGALSNSHNSKGVGWFLNQGFPVLKNKVEEKKYQIHFIGSTDDASNEIMKFRDEPNLYFRGFVKDLEKELSESDFAIVPPGYPTGIRTKISEAFAYGLPVITGRHDAYGVGLSTADPRVIIADDPQAYADACVRLINDKELRCKMGKVALETWRTDYDPGKIINDISAWITDNAD